MIPDEFQMIPDDPRWLAEMMSGAEPENGKFQKVHPHKEVQKKGRVYDQMSTNGQKRIVISS